MRRPHCRKGARVRQEPGEAKPIAALAVLLECATDSPKRRRTRLGARRHEVAETDMGVFGYLPQMRGDETAEPAQLRLERKDGERTAIEFGHDEGPKRVRVSDQVLEVRLDPFPPARQRRRRFAALEPLPRLTGARQCRAPRSSSIRKPGREPFRNSV